MRYMVASSDLPINADFESGFAHTTDQLFDSVSMAIETGVAGLSIEDSTGDLSHPVRDISEAVERMQAARAAIDVNGGDTVLVGRAENYVLGLPDLDDTIRRLIAYSEAGADCLYAPGIKTREEIQTVVSAVAPKPVNVLIGWTSDLSVDELADLGVRRISVGGALARAAWNGFITAARTMNLQGRFDGFNNSLSSIELEEMLSSPKYPK